VKRLVPVAAAVVLGLGLVASGPSHEGQDGARSAFSRSDLTATALAAPESQNVVDDALSTSHGSHGNGDVNTSASANSGCDECSATATALHIAYVNRPAGATLDNVTVAWSQCESCFSTAVSVQVVILRAPQTVRANNRALAVNATCIGCRTAAAAYQLVVVGERHQRLTPADVEQLRQWIADRAAALRAVSPANGSIAKAASSVAPVGQLEALVSEGLGGATTIVRDADVRTGAAGSAPEAPPREAQPTEPPTTEPPTTEPPTTEPSPPEADWTTSPLAGA
jgi:hypothetical protein